MTVQYALGISDGVHTIVSIGLLLAIFIPLSLAAAKELTELRQRGEEPPAQMPARGSLIGLGAFMVAFRGFALWFIFSNGNFMFPLLPVLGTIWFPVNIRRYRRAAEPATSDSATGTG